MIWTTLFKFLAAKTFPSLSRPKGSSTQLDLPNLDSWETERRANTLSRPTKWLLIIATSLPNAPHSATPRPRDSTPTTINPKSCPSLTPTFALPRLRVASTTPLLWKLRSNQSSPRRVRGIRGTVALTGTRRAGGRVLPASHWNLCQVATPRRTLPSRGRSHLQSLAGQQWACLLLGQASVGGRSCDETLVGRCLGE